MAEEPEEEPPRSEEPKELVPHVAFRLCPVRPVQRLQLQLEVGDEGVPEARVRVEARPVAERVVEQRHLFGPDVVVDIFHGPTTHSSVSGSGRGEGEFHSQRGNLQESTQT